MTYKYLAPWVYFVICIGSFGFTPAANAELLAFPTAEGHGKNATGGRGGEVYEVTNLNSSGSGSLGEALSGSGRTVVFRVSGTIRGRFTVPNNTTIAGQTAPGDGITIFGQLNHQSNVIIRYIRVRHDFNGNDDAMGTRYQNDVMIDHVSVSWGRDEVLSPYHGENITIQWSMITEPCGDAGGGHKFVGIWGNDLGSHHYNLIAHSESRNPRWASGAKRNDFRNNVLYNWGYNGAYGGEKQQVGNAAFNYTSINYVGNYFKAGPGTNSSIRCQILDPSTRNGDADAGQWWVSDNYVHECPDVTANNWLGVTRTGPAFRLDAPWPSMPIDQLSAQDAYEAVLAGVGASLPARDAIDQRIIADVRNGTATNGNNGFIDCPEHAQLPQLNSTPAPADSDHDGMPDDWEIEKGLNPSDASDRNSTNLSTDGYTNLEMYLNEVAGDFGGTTRISHSVAGKSIASFYNSERRTLTIRMNQIKNLDVSLFSLDGKKVLSKKFNGSENGNVEIPLIRFKNGTYLVHSKYDGSLKTSYLHIW